MQTNTITRALPELDESVSARLGDEILLDTASAEKSKKVSRTANRNGTPQSHTARAWTKGGSVD